MLYSEQIATMEAISNSHHTVRRLSETDDLTPCRLYSLWFLCHNSYSSLSSQRVLVSTLFPLFTNAQSVLTKTFGIPLIFLNRGKSILQAILHSPSIAVTTATPIILVSRPAKQSRNPSISTSLPRNHDQR